MDPVATITMLISLAQLARKTSEQIADIYAYVKTLLAQAASLEPALLELAGGSGSSFSDKILTKIKDTLIKVIDFANMYTENTLKRYALKAIRCSTYASQIKALRQELMECYAILNIAMGVDENVQREQDIEDLKKEFNGLAMDIMGQISSSGNDAEERFNKLQEELR